ncbi:MAG: hypothetical protein ACLFTK_06730 [Anaerolineales bacterium]
MTGYDWASLLDPTPAPPRRKLHPTSQESLQRKAEDFRERHTPPSAPPSASQTASEEDTPRRAAQD